jgi:Flp pilus assembly protein TadD
LNPSLRSRPRLRQALLATLLSACLGSALAQSTAQPPPPPTEPQQIEQLVRERKYADALKRADDWLVKNPRNAQVRFLRAIALAETGKAADAQAALEAMTAEFPELPEPYNNLAVMHAAAGRYELARSLLQRAIDVAPNYVTARENLGDLHIAIAVDVYTRALALDPNNAALKARLQTATAAAGRLRSAR